jgi:hypothetical protein
MKFIALIKLSFNVHVCFQVGFSLRILRLLQLCMRFKSQTPFIFIYMTIPVTFCEKYECEKASSRYSLSPPSMFYSLLKNLFSKEYSEGKHLHLT